MSDDDLIRRCDAFGAVLSSAPNADAFAYSAIAKIPQVSAAAEIAALQARAEAAERERDAAREALLSAGIALHVAKREAVEAEAALVRAYMAGRDDAAAAFTLHPWSWNAPEIREKISALPVPADLAKRLGVGHE